MFLSLGLPIYFSLFISLFCILLSVASGNKVLSTYAQLTSNMGLITKNPSRTPGPFHTWGQPVTRIIAWYLYRVDSQWSPVL